jgi:anhydro-N-acetylmuramic acid kinase
MNLNDPTKPMVALGLMSGTSLDGIDAALLETDGETVLDIGPSLTIPYPDDFRRRLKKEVELASSTDQITTDTELITDLTSLHITSVQKLLSLETTFGKWSAPQVIGFHGHTTLHRPEHHITQQIGNPDQLANAIGVPVVADFRVRDVELGGQGAPLAPIFHASMFRSKSKPICVVNIGGISNITWIGKGCDELIAFDTGPGNGLLDAWVERMTGQRFDDKGKLSATGVANRDILSKLLSNPYFLRRAPKSLDRSDFSLELLEGLNASDGSATLISFTVETIIAGLYQCPSLPSALYVTGGGRHNDTLMKELTFSSPCPVHSIEQENWNGDMIEAQAFAFMAVRCVRDMPITFKGTTGTRIPLTGGVLVNPTIT